MIQCTCSCSTPATSQSQPQSCTGTRNGMNGRQSNTGFIRKWDLHSTVGFYCNTGSHWTLLVADTSEKTVQIADSSTTANNDHYVSMWNDYLKTRSLTVSDLNGEWSERSLKMPQQQDGHSCGVLMLIASEAIIKDTSQWNQCRRPRHVPTVHQCTNCWKLSVRSGSQLLWYAVLQRSKNKEDRMDPMGSVWSLLSPLLHFFGTWLARSVHLCDLPVLRVNKTVLTSYLMAVSSNLIKKNRWYNTLSGLLLLFLAD